MFNACTSACFLLLTPLSLCFDDVLSMMCCCFVSRRLYVLVACVLCLRFSLYGALVLAADGALSLCALMLCCR